MSNRRLPSPDEVARAARTPLDGLTVAIVAGDEDWRSEFLDALASRLDASIVPVVEAYGAAAPRIVCDATDASSDELPTCGSTPAVALVVALGGEDVETLSMHLLERGFESVVLVRPTESTNPHQP